MHVVVTRDGADPVAQRRRDLHMAADAYAAQPSAAAAVRCTRPVLKSGAARVYVGRHVAVLTPPATVRRRHPGPPARMSSGSTGMFAPPSCGSPAWRRATMAGRPVRPFDHIVIDEAQDLAPAELKFFAEMAPAAPDGLFLSRAVGHLWNCSTPKACCRSSGNNGSAASPARCSTGTSCMASSVHAAGEAVERGYAVSARIGQDGAGVVQLVGAAHQQRIRFPRFQGARCTPPGGPARAAWARCPPSVQARTMLATRGPKRSRMTAPRSAPASSIASCSSPAMA